MVSYADRITALPPYLFAEVDRAKQQKIKEGVDIIDLGVGDPDTPTPDYVIESLCKAVHTSRRPTSIPSYSGSTVFRDAAAIGVRNGSASSWTRRPRSSRSSAPRRASRTSRSAFVNPGDYTLCPNPAYPVYAIGTTLADGKPYDMPLLAENGFKPDLSQIPADIVKKSKMIFINYPNNPRRPSPIKSSSREVIDFGKDNGIVVVSRQRLFRDHLSTATRRPSILEIPGAMDCCIEFHSLSRRPT